jgi:hypothetical protein
LTEETGQAGAEIEVTPAMMEAGEDEIYQTLYVGQSEGILPSDDAGTMGGAAARIYRAMAAAAPSKS